MVPLKTLELHEGHEVMTEQGLATLIVKNAEPRGYALVFAYGPGGKGHTTIVSAAAEKIWKVKL